MIRIMPKWYGEAEKELDRVIIEIAQKNNLKFCLVMDSKTISRAKESILQAMVMIYENSPGEFTEEQLKDFQMMEKSYKEQKNAKAKKKKRH